MLAGFAKTGLLQPGDSEKVTVTFAPEDMASYDETGAKAYVLEAGTYQIKLMSNAHDVIDQREYEVPATITYSGDNARSTDLVAATNEFEDVAQGQIQQYVSRADWEGTLPTARTDGKTASAETVATKENTPVYENNDSDQPITVADHGLTLEDMTGLDYDDPKWNDLLEQLSVDDMTNMIANGGWSTPEITSVGKPATNDLDGPAGINSLVSSLKGGSFPSESEGLDRTHIGIPAVQKQLLDAVTAANSNVVAVVSAGSVIETDWVEQCKAVVHGYLGGQAGAGAMLEVLTGRRNPCSKLAETIPLRYEDTPAARYFPGKKQNAEYREGLYVGYRYYETANRAVRYPFGYGLSYTTFAYSDLQVNADTVTFTLTNTGNCAGAEVAQLYVAKPDAKVFRPAKELKGFVKVFLQPGESKSVTIPLDDKTFRYWNVTTDRWEVEGGSYRLLVGANVQDIRLTAEIALPGTGAPDPYAGKELEHYRTAHVQEVPDAEFEALLGRPLPEEATAIDRTMTLGELHHSRSPLCWLIAGVLTLLVRSGEKRGKPNLNILFQYNMPLRGLAQMTGGIIGEETVDGLVMEAKGFWVIGILRALVGLLQNYVANNRYQAKLDEQSR